MTEPGTYSIVPNFLFLINTFGGAIILGFTQLAAESLGRRGWEVFLPVRILQKQVSTEITIIESVILIVFSTPVVIFCFFSGNLNGMNDNNYS